MVKKALSQNHRNLYVHHTLTTLGILLVFLCVATFPARASEAPMEEELQKLQSQVESLIKNQEMMLKEIKTIKGLLKNPRKASPEIPANLHITIEGKPFKGSPTAPVTLIEFSDYECPYCGRHVRKTFPPLDRNYIQTGKVKYVFKNFPIISIHKNALKAAEAASCAGKQEKYWPMHDRLFADQKKLTMDDLIEHAKTIKLKLPLFRKCLEEGKESIQIQQEIKEGQKAGVRGTPTFFLGRTDITSTKVKVLQILRGALPYHRFQKAIESLYPPPDEGDHPKNSS